MTILLAVWVAWLLWERPRPEYPREPGSEPVHYRDGKIYLGRGR